MDLLILSLKIWNDVVKTLNLKNVEKYLRWCSYDTEFTPNNLDSRFKMWASRGLSAYCTLMKKWGNSRFSNSEQKFRTGTDGLLQISTNETSLQSRS